MTETKQEYILRIRREIEETMTRIENKIRDFEEYVDDNRKEIQ